MAVAARRVLVLAFDPPGSAGTSDASRSYGKNLGKILYSLDAQRSYSVVFPCKAEGKFWEDSGAHKSASTAAVTRMDTGKRNVEIQKPIFSCPIFRAASESLVVGGLLYVVLYPDTAVTAGWSTGIGSSSKVSFNGARAKLL